MSSLSQAGVFVIQTLFDLYLLVLMLRTILFYFRFDYYHPIAQAIIRLTEPVIAPVKKIIPARQRIEFASILVLFLLTLLKFTCIHLILGSKMPSIIGLLLLSAGDLFNLFVYIFFFAIIIQAIISWVAPHQHNPFTGLLHQLTEPLMRPVRKRLPPISGLDISPIFVLIFLQVLVILIGNTLIMQGKLLS